MRRWDGCGIRGSEEVCTDLLMCFLPCDCISVETRRRWSVDLLGGSVIIVAIGIVVMYIVYHVLDLSIRACQAVHWCECHT